MKYFSVSDEQPQVDASAAANTATSSEEAKTINNNQVVEKVDEIKETKETKTKKASQLENFLIKSFLTNKLSEVKKSKKRIDFATFAKNFFNFFTTPIVLFVYNTVSLI